MKMHGPDKDVRLELMGSSGVSAVTLSDVYDIIHDRLEYARLTVSAGHGAHHLTRYKVPLEECTDIDALAQNCMVELRKKLGLYDADN